MQLRDSKLRIAAAAAIAGYLNMQLVTLFWVFWQPVNPIANAIFGQRAVSPYYAWALYPTDLLTSVLVSLPLGVFIAWLGIRHFRWAVAFATLPYLSSFYWPALVQVIPSARWQTAVIAALTIAVVPLASCIGRWLLRRFTPNNSFKPSPLRSLGQNPPFSGGPA